jgi:hypothetical protein
MPNAWNGGMVEWWNGGRMAKLETGNWAANGSPHGTQREKDAYSPRQARAVSRARCGGFGDVVLSRDIRKNAPTTDETRMIADMRFLLHAPLRWRWRRLCGRAPCAGERRTSHTELCGQGWPSGAVKRGCARCCSRIPVPLTTSRHLLRRTVRSGWYAASGRGTRRSRVVSSFFLSLRSMRSLRRSIRCPVSVAGSQFRCSFHHSTIPRIGHRLYRSSPKKFPCGVRRRKRLSAIIRVSSVAKSSDAGEADSRAVRVARSQ